MNLIKLIDPTRGVRKERSAVHYQAPDGQALLCGHSLVYTEIDGERFRVWHETKQPVNCGSCTKRLEMLVRLQITDLDSGQLEDLLAHIAALRQS